MTKILECSKENWRAIPGFQDYEVSDFGRVRSFRRVKTYQDGRENAAGARPYRILVQSDKNGYRSVNLSSKRTLRSRTVHRLVMLAFVGPCPDGMEVCHGDSNRANNRLDNLRYDTHKRNMEGAAQLGRMNNGKRKAQKSEDFEWDKQDDMSFRDLDNIPSADDVVSFNRACTFIGMFLFREQFSLWRQANEMPTFATLSEWENYAREFEMAGDVLDLYNTQQDAIR